LTDSAFVSAHRLQEGQVLLERSGDGIDIRLVAYGFFVDFKMRQKPAELADRIFDGLPHSATI
jgi:hypothetical protein